MKKKIAVIFSHSPYGNTLGEEGLNFVLSASCYTNNIYIFFIGDGIFQVVDNQENKNFILQKYYFSSLNLLKSYDMHHFYICFQSLLNRGLNKNHFMNIHAKIVDNTIIRNKINQCHHILNF